VVFSPRRRRPAPAPSLLFLVRVPQSLHAAVEREAAPEGLSLHQLVVAKFAGGLGRLAGLALKVEREEGNLEEVSPRFMSHKA